MRIADYSSPPPFSDLFARRYDPAVGDEEARSAQLAMRRRTVTSCVAGALTAAFLTAGYLVYGLAIRRLPTWSLVLAVLLGVGLDLVLIRTYRAVRRDPSRAAAARTIAGRVLVAGCDVDVRQHCLASLIDLGARLVRVDGSRVLAASGVSFGRDMWMGEIIWVTLSDGPPGHVWVAVSSTKADFVSRSRSRRNVVGFLESWAIFPSSQRALVDA